MARPKRAPAMSVSNSRRPPLEEETANVCDRSPRHHQVLRAADRLDRPSFGVDAGAVVGFLGPSGAGKTTTLRMLLGLVEPVEGSATICGRRYRELPDPLHRVGAVLEASSAYPGRTARNHLRIRTLAGHVPSTRVDEVLGLVGLTSAAGRRVGEFSLGMRQRLGLATALLCDPEILILDEPANGLDPEGVRWPRDMLRGLGRRAHRARLQPHPGRGRPDRRQRGRLVAHSAP